MPLFSLAATALDQPQPRSVVIAALVHYLHTDPVVCRDEPGPLADRQAAVLNPLLEWVRRRMGAALAPSSSIFGADLPGEELAKVEAYLQGAPPPPPPPAAA
jgi:ATP synthase F1 complex assembly factor 2